jgi:hypothetical protein
VVVRGDVQTETQGQNQTETGTQPPSVDETAITPDITTPDTTTPDTQDVPLSEPGADIPTTPPAQNETQAQNGLEAPNPIFE